MRLYRTIWINVNVWLDSDMEFKLGVVEDTSVSAFIPMDVKWFPSRRRLSQIQVPLQSLRDELYHHYHSSDYRYSRSMRWMGGLLPRYSIILTAPESILLSSKMIWLMSDCSMSKSTSGLLPRSQWVKWSRTMRFSSQRLASVKSTDVLELKWLFPFQNIATTSSKAFLR